MRYTVLLPALLSIKLCSAQSAEIPSSAQDDSGMSTVSAAGMVQVDSVLSDDEIPIPDNQGSTSPVVPQPLRIESPRDHVALTISVVGHAVTILGIIAATIVGTRQIQTSERNALRQIKSSEATSDKAQRELVLRNLRVQIYERLVDRSEKLRVSVRRLSDASIRVDRSLSIYAQLGTGSPRVTAAELLDLLDEFDEGPLLSHMKSYVAILPDLSRAADGLEGASKDFAETFKIFYGNVAVFLRSFESETSDKNARQRSLSQLAGIGEADYELKIGLLGAGFGDARARLIACLDSILNMAQFALIADLDTEPEESS